jgi:hypothetical protein
VILWRVIGVAGAVWRERARATASVIALGRVQALVMTTDSYAAFIDEYPNVPDLVKRQTHERRTGRPERP